jgi:hypothetical protein
MANADRPRGFIPIGRIGGGEICATPYVVTTSQTIFIGDPVIITSGGTVSVSAANMDAIGLGISADWITSAAAGTIIHVYDDPNLLFMVQTTNSITTDSSSVFNTANMITYAGGDTTTGLSIMELDTPGTSTGDFMILGLYNAPDNAWGEFSKVVVRFNQHLFQTVHAGL